MDRLLGAARLLSQMVEPMPKAAIEVSILLARSFFMGFSLTILALLGRLRVLVQQILIDVVAVFNMVSSLSQKKQSVKITHEGIEVFREYYPSNKEFVTLECTWKTDKFILLERTHKSDIESQDGDLENAFVETPALRYKSIESFLGDDSGVEKLNEDRAEEDPTNSNEDKKDLMADTSTENDNQLNVEGGVDVELGNNTFHAGTPEEKLSPEGSLLAIPSSSSTSKPFRRKSSAKSMAFVSIKRPAPSTAAFVSVKRPATSTSNVTVLDYADAEKDNSGKEDSFFNLLTGGNLKDSLF